MSTHALSFRCSPSSSGDDAPHVPAPPPLILLAGLGAGIALHALVADLARPGVAGRVVAYVLLLAGGAFAAAFVRGLRRARTSIAFGAGTALVTTGAYRLSRNPGYVGMALTCAGVVVLTGAWLAFATLAAALVVVDRCVVAAEERHLERRFGAEYAAYRQRTRRWL